VIVHHIKFPKNVAPYTSNINKPRKNHNLGKARFKSFSAFFKSKFHFFTTNVLYATFEQQKRLPLSSLLSSLYKFQMLGSAMFKQT